MQFMLINGVYKLNDFNLCRFIPWNYDSNIPCTVEIESCPGTYRSPEEYILHSSLSEKIDVYSMGNVFYGLLTELWPFKYIHDDTRVKTKIISGERPYIPPELLKSNDPIHSVFLQSIEMCWNQNPSQRPSAIDIANYLDKELSVIKNLL